MIIFFSVSSNLATLGSQTRPPIVQNDEFALVGGYSTVYHYHAVFFQRGIATFGYADLKII